MAKPKLKKKAGAVGGSSSGGSSSSSSSSSTKRSLMDSAQQIWMAGLGAFHRAQDEGGKLFELLVKEGSTLEQKTRRFATGKVDEARGSVETTVATVKERAADTWDRLEKVFEERVSRALGKLGVPGRDEMQALTTRVEELNRQVRKLNARPEPAARKAVPKAQPRAASTEALEASGGSPQGGGTRTNRTARKPRA
jgi:poly(hydroxyalkanoate) granule-associated protein